MLSFLKRGHIDIYIYPQAKALSNICEDLGLADVWRTIPIADKAYTFFPPLMAATVELITFSCQGFLCTEF